MAVVKLGFFTRLLERADAAHRYRFAAEQARHAEQLGFDTVWVAQHHFHAAEDAVVTDLLSGGRLDPRRPSRPSAAPGLESPATACFCHARTPVPKVNP